MLSSAEKVVNIREELVSGDVDFSVLRNSSSKYNMIPIGIMVSKDSATDEVVDVTFSLRGDQSSEKHYLKINEFYPFAVDKIYQTGTDAATDIYIYGLIN